MKLLTRDSDYALRILRFMALHKNMQYTAIELQKKLKIPFRFLRKILQLMNKNALLNSYKGVGGGFTLSRSPEDITILNVMEAFQGKMDLAHCMFKKEICPDRSACALRKRILKMQEHLLAELKTITIASLLEHHKTKSRIKKKTT